MITDKTGSTEFLLKSWILELDYPVGILAPPLAKYDLEQSTYLLWNENQIDLLSVLLWALNEIMLSIYPTAWYTQMLTTVTTN